MKQRGQRTRVAAYAVIVRDDQVLLSRLAPRLSAGPMWTLPGGGVEFGEDPGVAVVREVYEETGLQASVSDDVWVDSQLIPGPAEDRHAIRLIYHGWVDVDAPQPRVVEVDGSTVDAAWHPIKDVLNEVVAVVPVVRRALDRYTAYRHQRLAAYALICRDDQVLLTRISSRGFAPGTWTLPGGGVDHGENPAAGLTREIAEETGLIGEVGALLGVHDTHFTGTAPNGRAEDFHGVHIVFDATVSGGEPQVVETDGTTDAVQWLPIAQVLSGQIPVFDVVTFALNHRSTGQ